MLVSLVPPGEGAIPITPVTPAEAPDVLAALGPAVERWADATRFAAEPGKLLLVPDERGRLGRVVVGTAGDALWALASCPDALPEGVYAVDRVRDRHAARTVLTRFVGATTLYALMQACGLVDDHLADCPARPGVERARSAAGLV